MARSCESVSGDGASTCSASAITPRGPLEVDARMHVVRHHHVDALASQVQRIGSLSVLHLDARLRMQRVRLRQLEPAQRGDDRIRFLFGEREVTTAQQYAGEMVSLCQRLRMLGAERLLGLGDGPGTQCQRRLQ